LKTTKKSKTQNLKLLIVKGRMNENNTKPFIYTGEIIHNKRINEIDSTIEFQNLTLLSNKKIQI
jgi:hypothetical protein